MQKKNTTPIDPEVLREAMRAEKAQYARDWRKNNIEKVNAYQRQWNKNNPEKKAEYNKRYWERKALARLQQEKESGGGE